ncbi:MAG: hypothetical protein R2854_08065 [Caldilineaceae bacterium]
MVGYHTADDYGGWTRDLLTTLKAGGGVMDFFTVHPYTFDFFPSAPPSNPATYAEFLLGRKLSGARFARHWTRPSPNTATATRFPSG